MEIFDILYLIFDIIMPLLQGFALVLRRKSYIVRHNHFLLSMCLKHIISVCTITEREYPVKLSGADETLFSPTALSTFIIC